MLFPGSLEVFAGRAASAGKGRGATTDSLWKKNFAEWLRGD
jgi:hypothetical protein